MHVFAPISIAIITDDQGSQVQRAIVCAAIFS